MSISIVFADDHEVVRYGLCLLLDGEADIEVVGQAANAPETLESLAKLRPDVLLLDLFMPGVTGTSLIEEIRQRHPEVQIVMMSGQAEEPSVLAGLRAGAVAFVRKDDEVGEMVKAVRAAAGGEKYLSPALAQKAIAAYVEGQPSEEECRLNQLTDREREVIRLAAGGLTSGEIGKQLFISRRTVETHRARAMQKLGLRNEVELVRFFLSLESQSK
jgi:DNA-binding NarL/FixJ family response regulator